MTLSKLPLKPGETYLWNNDGYLMGIVRHRQAEHIMKLFPDVEIDKHSYPILRVCMSCKTILSPPYKRGRKNGLNRYVTHGLCDECYKEMARDIEELEVDGKTGKS